MGELKHHRMNILTLNCGSSSVKYALLQMPGGKQLCHGIADRVGLPGASILHYASGDAAPTRLSGSSTPEAAVEEIINLAFRKKTGNGMDSVTVNAVGHRVVHGGEKFTSSVLIDEEVMRSIEECSELAPLHNPANIAGIRAAIRLMPHIPNIAIFDTAFFATMPPHTYIYGLPYEWYEKYRIRRYGFHGTSHSYVFHRLAALLGRKPTQVNAITLHIGNGVSVTAVKKGAAYDHSMGFTPLEGAVMGTRCGDIDPSIPLYVMKREGLSSEDMESMLNRKSGLLGITGRYSDRREILADMDAGDERAALAFEIECHRLKKYVGAYTATLGKVDGIAFTGGVGENSPRHRWNICDGLQAIGIEVDRKSNDETIGGVKETEISTPRSAIRLFVIPTNEELVLAQEASALLGKVRRTPFSSGRRTTDTSRRS